MQFGMLWNVRLNEHGAALRIKPGGQPVQQDLERVLLDARGIGVVGGERVPVSKEEKAIVLVLHADPVVQGADKVSQMQFAGGAHTAEHAFALVGARGHQILRRRPTKSAKTGLMSLDRSPPPQNTRRSRPKVPTVS